MIRYILFLIVFVFNMASAQECDGDANTDSIINILDIVSMAGYILGNSELIGDAYENADSNNDGSIDILDIVNITNLILIGESECPDFDIPLDLSLDWETEEDLSYFDFESLDEIMDQLENLSSLYGIVVIHRGKIVGEEYYGPGGLNAIYNIFSVTKSYISTLIGQGIDQGLVPPSSTTLNNVFETDYGQPYLSQLTLENVLTMSTGYSDFYGYPYWVQQPTQSLVYMPYTQPGYFFYNNSACHLNSHILYESTGMTPNEFAQENLFPYLGIENPDWLYGYNGINDGSASLELRLRDMVKLGQLYLQDGFSGEDQILSTEYIDQATSYQLNTGMGFGYGYLWWIPPNEGFMAIGYGGQIIAVFPERNLVIGTHSYTFSSQSYQNSLNNYILNYIVPLFEN